MVNPLNLEHLNKAIKDICEIIKDDVNFREIRERLEYICTTESQ